MQPTATAKEEDVEGGLRNPQAVALRQALLLGVAYSANVGGTGVITGTSPNLVLMGFYSE